MHIDDLRYDLPPDLIAQQPTERREDARLLVIDRAKNGPGQPTHAAALPEYLRPGDCLVINDTRVVPARFAARRVTGGRVEGLYLRSETADTWTALLKPSARLRQSETIDLVGTDAKLHLSRALGGGEWEVRIDPPQPAPDLLERIGWTPLPPYIKRPTQAKDAALSPEARERERLDRQRYQTVYAREPGAVAAPTAGLHLTEGLLSRLELAGVRIAPVTLHVGLGTFEPIKVERLEDHRMHAEWYELTACSAEAVAGARASGGRVIAVGTTSARVLESCADEDGSVRPGRGMTDIFIYPPYTFRAVDVLLTNFHLPCSTLLAMVLAFAGQERILAAYRQAIELRFRFYSYGDAMLIL
ncbi:MAG: tRNA preQ1(34) S-adenosylmethionine ribosyltransferase-isomerase QueA [Phycisphaerae bacterium]|nr:tRNA preQ1(34) S-adenosylmethionine ribosyltransferase-isomerase QueA [Phycisphaerae bacterium]